MKLTPLAFGLAAALLVPGCTSFKVPDIVSYHKNRTDTWRNKYFGVEMINPYTYRPPDCPTNIYAQALDYKQHPDEARMARNRLQTVMMTLSDQAVAKHLARVTGMQIDSNVLLGAGALAAAGEAAIAPPATAKVAAQVATGLLGFKGLFNDEVYRNALVQTLVASIISDRNQLRAEIKAQQILSITSYPVDQALADVNDIHSRGSFYYGLTLIRQAAEAANLARNGEASNAVQKVTVQQQKRKALKATEAATEDQITDVGFMTDQLKTLSDDPDKAKSLQRANALLAGAKAVGVAVDTTPAATLPQALEKLQDVQEFLIKPENRALIPKIRKLFEAIQ